MRSIRPLVAALIMVVLTTACAATTPTATPGAPQSPSPSATPSPTPSPEPLPAEEGPITITEPAEGATVGTTFTMAGMALVFEANVTIRIHDDGELILTTFATAEDGTMFSPWETEITLPEDVSGTIVLSAVDVSAEDGSDAYVVSRTVIVA